MKILKLKSNRKVRMNSSKRLKGGSIFGTFKSVAKNIGSHASIPLNQHVNNVKEQAHKLANHAHNYIDQRLNTISNNINSKINNTADSLNRKLQLNDSQPVGSGLLNSSIRQPSYLKQTKRKSNIKLIV